MLSSMYPEISHLWMQLMRQNMYRNLQEKMQIIIFGAMYDDSRADEATITVIATGLHNVGGSASKLKVKTGESGQIFGYATWSAGTCIRI